MDRPNPDQLLNQIGGVPEKVRGKLRIFLGYAAGVGKTYAMLDEAKAQLKHGHDVVIGYIEPHNRPETAALLEGIPAIGSLPVSYRNIVLNEFDLQGALNRNPEILLVDELAHTNAEGLRNRKRYQDIEELLNAGIDVYTTINIQHIESLNDIVEEITRVAVKETVPDYIIDHADKIKLVDIEPEELLIRLQDGKIYRKERAESAMEHFFTVDNLRLLREMALRKATDRISSVNLNIRESGKILPKYLVCVNASPSSARCIRWTARYAEANHSTWCAVYVETSNSVFFNDKENETIKKNLELARMLGADVTTITGDDVPVVVSEYANQSGITNFVIGRSRHEKTRSPFKKSLEDELIRRIQGATVHVITDNDAMAAGKKDRRFTLKNTFLFNWIDLLKSVGILALATVVNLALQRFDIAEQNVIMVYILSVLVISVVTDGYLYGVTFALVSVLTFNFLFVEPLYTFSAIQPEYMLTFLIMFLVAFITSALMNKIKIQARQSAKRAKRTETLYEINKKLLLTRGVDQIVGTVNEYVAALFQRSVVFYSDDPGNPGSITLLIVPEEKHSDLLTREEEKAVANWVFLNKKEAGFGTNTLMGASVFYTPVLSRSRVLGVIGLSCTSGHPVSLDFQNFLRMIASLVATALERQRSSDEQRRLMVESEKEAVRSNLLRAISHDLRTPLTAIMGASSVLLESEETLEGEVRSRLIRNIRDDAAWLIRLVENILSVTKLSEEGVKLKKRPEAVEEVVAEAVARIRNKYPEAAFRVQVPKDLLVVPMDGTLIEQVVINLLDNAIRYSRGEVPVELIVEKEGSWAAFHISDSGIGIPEEEMGHLFDGNLSGQADSSRGFGIGLSICKSIVRSHGGDIRAVNKPEGGAMFTFRLPLEG